MKQPKTVRAAYDRSSVRRPKWEPGKLNWGAGIGKWPIRRKAARA
jgi:hypothetical protein